MLPGGQVAETLAEFVGKLGNDAELLGVALAARVADAQHEIARRGDAEKQTVPFEPLLVRFRHFLPVPGLGVAENVGQGVEPVLFALDEFHLVLRGIAQGAGLLNGMTGVMRQQMAEHSLATPATCPRFAGLPDSFDRGSSSTDTANDFPLTNAMAIADLLIVWQTRRR
ncbi:hypothetical protein HRbin36_02460 [bacterium HR36]|nr:hypothetical protein HRbin36_02460 [bacterium HR36]